MAARVCGREREAERHRETQRLREEARIIRDLFAEVEVQGQLEGTLVITECLEAVSDLWVARVEVDVPRFQVQIRIDVKKLERISTFVGNCSLSIFQKL